MNGMENEGTGSGQEERRTERPTANQETKPPAGRWIPTNDPRRKNVALATIMSAFPGLGHIYVGYYQLGFTHILIFASLVTILSKGAGGLEPLFGLSLAFFILYNIVDGARRASLYNLALDSGGQMPELELPRNRGSMAGGIFLVGLGVLILLHTRFDMDMYWLEEWWPLGLIGLGAWLVYTGRKNRARSGMP
ncbi:MAG TPA: DUF5668 domain-containing protein [Candidatus Krumholzibacteria bacterium]|nr:DUF5668 domain-containing protein [Candidatus Krumholzibacteria bacterium]